MAYVAEEAKRHPRELIVSLIEGFLDIECAEVRQTFSAVVMSPDVAEHFNSKPGVPALKIVRCYLDREGNTITASESFIPQNVLPSLSLIAKSILLAFVMIS